jgi:hypothetical protein
MPFYIFKKIKKKKASVARVTSTRLAELNAAVSDRSQYQLLPATTH